ncbi:MAG: ATP-binding cassette domain-containing protein [Clostridia bacterium]|nr:ATP-binding cassette domain-containing protein [Clostridia bacterium]
MLKLDCVSVTFNKGTKFEVTGLDGLSLHLAPGDFATVIGSNGAGKSTLMNVVSGSVEADSGRVVIDGRDVTLDPEHKRASYIGHLFQDPMRGTAPGMTIAENLALAAGRGGWLSVPSRADRALFRERLAALGMGLEDRMNSPVGLLSGGQRQALTLLMATFNPPKLLLLDEHTAALDPATAETVLELTRRTVEDNRLCCLMITHNIKDALALGGRILMMDRGRIIFDASGDEKRALTVDAVLDRFRSTGALSDRMALGQ